MNNLVSRYNSFCRFFLLFFSAVPPLLVGAQKEGSTVVSTAPEFANYQTTFYANFTAVDTIRRVNVSSTDDFVLKLNTEGEKGKDIEALAHLLTDSIKEDSLKIRAIFFWMTQNIAYDIKQFRDHKSEPFVTKKENEKAIDAVKRWEWERARTTLVKRRGIASDNALLFYYLCNFSGIQCKVLAGLSGKKNPKTGLSTNETPNNHCWNAVRINNRWYILDVTAASGYCDDKVKVFTRKLNEFYYLINRDDLIYDPDPAQGVFKVKANSIISTVEIIDQVGKQIYFKEINSDKMEIDFSKLVKGNYRFRLISANSLIEKKLIIED